MNVFLIDGQRFGVVRDGCIVLLQLRIAVGAIIERFPVLYAVLDFQRIVFDGLFVIFQLPPNKSG